MTFLIVLCWIVAIIAGGIVVLWIIGCIQGVFSERSDDHDTEW